MSRTLANLVALPGLFALLCACVGEPPHTHSAELDPPMRQGGMTDALGPSPLVPPARFGTFNASQFSAEDEAIIGEATARHLLAAHDLLDPDHPTARYVRKLGALLSMGGTRPEVRYRFAVLITPEIDSCAAPDGWVFITTGLLRFLENEAELAFILAHEICHVEHRDGLELLAKAQGDLAKRAMRERLAQLTTQPASETEKELQARMDELSDLVLRGKGLPQEIRADAFALRLIQRTGYEPMAATRLFERLARLQGSGPIQPLIFRSHPHLEERAASAAKDAARLPRGGALLSERYRQAMQPLPEEEKSR